MDNIPLPTPEELTEGLFNTKVGDGHLIDGDTLRTNDGESIRILNIDTPEVAHSDDWSNPDFHAAGITNQKEIARLANEYGFTQPLKTGQKDTYGRELGDLVNPDTGERLSYFLVREGITPTVPWADKESVDQSVLGRSQRIAGEERDESIQRAFEEVWEANGEPDFKRLALTESEYDPEIHAGVSLRRLDRTLDNKALRPLSTSFDTALIGMGAALQGMKQMVGHVTGNEAMEQAGRLGVAERQDRLRRMPEVIIDYKDVDSISDGFQYLANNAVMSAPYMANTIASAVAGSAAGAVVGSAVPVVGTVAGGVVGGIVGLSSPTAIYAGQVYNGQDEKNWQVALTSGLAQATLDRLGVHGISASGTLKGVLKEAEEALVEKGVSRAMAKSRVAAATKTELMGLVDDADSIIKQQLRGRAIARTLVNRAAKGMGSEAVTEAAQETLGQIGENWNTENLGLFDTDGFNSQFIDRITNAAIAGGTLGGAFGTAGGVREVGGWADAAWDRGDSRKSFEDTLANLEDQNKTLAEEMADMQRGEQDSSDLAFRINADIENRQKMSASEKAIETVKNAPILWRGMMRARMQKDSLIKSSSYRTLAGIFGGTLGRIKPGEQYEDSMNMTAQRYNNILGSNEKIWYQGIGKNDRNSKDKFNAVIGRFDRDFNQWFDENTDKRGNFKDGVTIEDYNWSQWDFLSSKDFRDKLSTDPTKNMVRQFYERRNEASDKMRERQNWWWRKNAKVIREKDGQTRLDDPGEKIKKLNNYLGKYKAINRAVLGKRRGDFEALLRSEYGMSKEASNELTTKILEGEPLDGHDDQVFDLISKGPPQTSAKAQTMGLAQNSKFTEFFHQDAFHNFREAARSAARFETYHKYVGRDNWRVSKLLDQAAKEGVPQEEVNMMARAIQNYLEAQSGNYKRPAKGSYGERALGVQRFALTWSLFTSLPLSMLSSTVELMLVTQGLTKSQIFNNINNYAAEMAGGLGRFMSRYSYDAFTGQEFMPNSVWMKRLSELGYLNWEAGAATTVGATEYADWSKGLVDRFFKYNGLEDLTNITRAMRLASLTDFITNHVDTIKNGDPKSESYRFANEQLRNLGLPVDRYIDLLDKQAEGTLSRKEVDSLEKMQMLAEYTYINQTVALPGASNRPLFYQDPRLALFTQFNGYVSTFTANHLPKMWSEYVGRGRPSMKYSTFVMMAMMIFMGFASQYLKDWLKYGEPSPYLDSNEKLRRAINSSGLIGQGERVLNFVWPTFESNADSVVGKGADMVLGEMPAMSPVRRLLKAADAAYQGEGDLAKYNALRATPVLGPFTGLAEKASGMDFSEFKN